MAHWRKAPAHKLRCSRMPAKALSVTLDKSPRAHAIIRNLKDSSWHAGGFKALKIFDLTCNLSVSHLLWFFEDILVFWDGDGIVRFRASFEIFTQFRIGAPHWPQCPVKTESFDTGCGLKTGAGTMRGEGPSWGVAPGDSPPELAQGSATWPQLQCSYCYPNVTTCYNMLQYLQTTIANINTPKYNII